MCGYASGPLSPADAKKREAEYRAEDDHRTMSRAAEIEGDKERMAGVRAHHRKVTGQHARIGKRLTSRSAQRR